MKLAIMQPYLFPYLGYFQLLAAVDRFVVYDDVAFIRSGWINRNRILVDGRAFRFSVPVRDASSFRCIFETQVDRALYGAWLRKFMMTVDQSYRSAPCFGPVRYLLDVVFSGFEGSVAALALRSLTETSRYLGIPTRVVETSRGYGNGELKGGDRVLDICAREGAHHYVNAIGGADLYTADEFAGRGVTLHFIHSRPVVYRQFGETFTPALSIIDVMMFNPPERIGELLREFDLVDAAASNGHEARVARC
jgi:hypothetical protein